MTKIFSLISLISLLTYSQNDSAVIASVVRMANDSCEKYYHQRSFKPQTCVIQNCKKGLMIHGLNMGKINCRSHILTFDAIKATEWNVWRIQVKDASNGCLTEGEKKQRDSLDKIFSPNNLRYNKKTTEIDTNEIFRTREKMRSLLHPDTIFKREYDYWKNK